MQKRASFFLSASAVRRPLPGPQPPALVCAWQPGAVARCSLFGWVCSHILARPEGVPSHAARGPLPTVRASMCPPPALTVSSEAGKQTPVRSGLQRTLGASYVRARPDYQPRQPTTPAGATNPATANHRGPTMAAATSPTPRQIGDAATLAQTITAAALDALPPADRAAAKVVEQYALDVAKSITHRLPGAVAAALTPDA